MKKLTGFYYKFVKLLLFAYIATLPFSGIMIQHNLSLAFIVASLYFTTRISGIFLFNHKIKRKLEYLYIPIILIYLIILDLFVHDGSINNRYYIAFALNSIIGMIILSDLLSEDDTRKQAILVFAGTVLFITALERFGIGRQVSSVERTTMFGCNENELALYILITLTCLLIYAAREQRLFAQILIFISSIASFNLLVDSGSRYSFVALLIIYGLYIPMLRFKNVKARLPILIMTASMALMAFKLSYSHMLRVRFAPFLIPEDPNVTIYSNISDLGGRLELWLNAWSAFTISPIFGNGYSGYQAFTLSSHKYFELPHNFFLEMAAIGGVGAIILALIATLVILKKVIQAPTAFQTLELLIWSCPLFVAVCMLNIVQIKAVWFLYVFLLALGTRMTQNQQKNSDHSFQQE